MKALFFSFYDQFEVFQIRNISKSREHYFDLLNKTTSQVNKSVAEELKNLGKIYLEKLIYNPVLLARRKIHVLLEFNNQSYTLSELNTAGYTHNKALRYYSPYVDLSQFWTFESNYTLERWFQSKDIFEVEIELEIVDKTRVKTDSIWKSILIPELTMIFNNLTTDTIKQWIYSKNYTEIWITVAMLLINLISRYICVREGRKVLKTESMYFDSYDPKLGLEWRFLFFQQITVYIVALSYCIRNSPFTLCIFYVLYAFIIHLIRMKVVELKFNMKFCFPMTIEIRNGQEYLPNNHVYPIISYICLFSMGVIQSY